jgi:MFS family permease
MDRRGPLAGSYPAAVALVVCALVPLLALAASLGPLTKLIASDLHLSRGALELTMGMSVAGYAVGTVISVQFAQHLRQRRMLLLYVTVFAVAAVVAAAAPTPGLFIAAFVLQGLCTSLMLIAAVPPLVIGFGADKIASTGVVMNLCIFGAVAAGPSIGSFSAAANDWRTLFWVVAGIAAAAWVVSLLTFGQEPLEAHSQGSFLNRPVRVKAPSESASPGHHPRRSGLRAAALGRRGFHQVTTSVEFKASRPVRSFAHVRIDRAKDAVDVAVACESDLHVVAPLFVLDEFGLKVAKTLQHGSCPLKAPRPDRQCLEVAHFRFPSARLAD